MNTDDSRDYALLDQLAEEFAERFRKGERPSLQEYADKYPHLADDLRDLLPAMAEIEQVKGDAPPKEPLPALRQVGEYQILREIGRGGMGVVYEAEQVTLGRRVALKVLAGGRSGQSLERFRREARAAAKLHHTNIVPVFGVGEHEGMPYYVMQFIQGLGLDAVMEEVIRLQALSAGGTPPSAVSARPRRDFSAAAMARSLVTGSFQPPTPDQAALTLTVAPGAPADPAPPASDSHASSSGISLPGQSNTSGRKATFWHSVAQIGLQVADALDYAHKQGILHRDIKPSNLLLDLHGVVWVTDFGLAKSDDQENLTNTGDMLGTLRYMPPEAFEGKNDARSDVYSLGLSIYELLALRPAYDERKREQLIKQVTTTEPPRLSGLNKAIPRDLQTIVHKAIEKDPKDRYPSAGDLAADLRRYLGDQPILARRVSPVERFTRWCKRNPTVAGLTAAVFTLLLAVAGVSASMAVRIERKADEARREANRASDEAGKAEVARLGEVSERRKTQSILSEQFVSRGARLQDEGDPGGAALCFAEALRLDAGDADREAPHRIRLAAALRDAPRPRHVFFHPSKVLCTAVTDDNKTLAAGCEDGTIQLWDVATGQKRLSLEHNGPVRELRFAAKGSRLWSGCDHPKPRNPVSPKGDSSTSRPDPRRDLRLWDLEARRPVVDGVHHLSVQFSPIVGEKGCVTFMPTESTLQVRDADTGEARGPDIVSPHPIDSYKVSLVAGRCGINWVVVGKGSSSNIGRTGLWDIKTGRTVGEPVSSTPARGVAWGGREDEYLLVSDRLKVRWLESRTGKEARTHESPSSSGLQSILSVSDDGRVAAVQRSLQGARPEESAGQGTFARTLIDVETGEPLGRELTGTSGLMTLSRDASRFISVRRDRLEVFGEDGIEGGSAVLPRAAGSGGVILSDDGGYLLLAFADNTARVYRVADAKPVTPLLPHTGPLVAGAFTPDGSHVVVASGTAVHLWPLGFRDESAEQAVFGVSRMLSGDGRRILEVAQPALQARGGETSDFGERLVDARTGAVVASTPWLDAATRPKSAAFMFAEIADSVVLRRDGRAVLLRASYLLRNRKKDPGVKPRPTVLWNADAGTRVELPRDGKATYDFAFTDDGRHVRWTGWDEEGFASVRLFDAATGTAVGPATELPSDPPSGSPKSFVTPVAPVAWSPTGDRVAVRIRTEAGPRVRQYDSRTGQAIGDDLPLDQRPGGAAAANFFLAYSRDGRRLVAAEESRGVPVRTGRGPAENRFPVGGTAFLSNLPDVSSVRVWDVASGRPLMPTVDGSSFGGHLVGVAVHGDATRLALVLRPAGADALQAFRGESTESVQLYDVDAGTAVGEPMTHDRTLQAAAFSPDGSRLVTTDANGNLRLWNAGTGGLLHVIAGDDRLVRVRFSSDGRRLATHSIPRFRTGRDNFGYMQTATCDVYDASTGQCLTPTEQGRLNIGDPRAVSDELDTFLAARPDGSMFVYRLEGDPRPPDHLLDLAGLVSGRRITATGLLQGVGPKAYESIHRANGPRFPIARKPLEGESWHKHNLERGEPGGGTAGGFSRVDPGFRRADAIRLWHLDRLVASLPEPGPMLAERALVFIHRHDWPRAEADLTAAIAWSPNSVRFGQRANARAEQGKFAEAAADYAESNDRAAKERPVFNSPVQPLERRASMALLALRLERWDDYRREAQYLLSVARDPKSASLSTNTSTPLRGLMVALLRPDPAFDYASVTLENVPAFIVGSTLGLTIVADVRRALAYRRGEYARVVDRDASLGGWVGHIDLLFEAMALHHLGKPADAKARLEEARKEFAKAMKPKTESSPPNWPTRVAFEVVLKEAEALIEGKK